MGISTGRGVLAPGASFDAGLIEEPFTYTRTGIAIPSPTYDLDPSAYDPRRVGVRTGRRVLAPGASFDAAILAEPFAYRTRAGITIPSPFHDLDVSAYNERAIGLTTGRRVLPPGASFDATVLAEPFDTPAVGIPTRTQLHDLDPSAYDAALEGFATGRRVLAPGASFDAGIIAEPFTAPRAGQTLPSPLHDLDPSAYNARARDPETGRRVLAPGASFDAGIIAEPFVYTRAGIAIPSPIHDLDASAYDSQLREPQTGRRVLTPGASFDAGLLAEPFSYTRAGITLPSFLRELDESAYDPRRPGLATGRRVIQPSPAFDAGAIEEPFEYTPPVRSLEDTLLLAETNLDAVAFTSSGIAVPVEPTRTDAETDIFRTQEGGRFSGRTIAPSVFAPTDETALERVVNAIPRRRTVGEILALAEADAESVQLTRTGVAFPRPVQRVQTQAELDRFRQPVEGRITPARTVGRVATDAEADPFRLTEAQPIARNRARAQPVTNTLAGRLQQQDAIVAQQAAFDRYEGASQRTPAFSAVTPLSQQLGEYDSHVFPSSPLSIHTVLGAGAPTYESDEEDPVLNPANSPLRTADDVLFGHIGAFLETTDVSASDRFATGPTTFQGLNRSTARARTLQNIRNVSRNRPPQKPDPNRPREIGIPVDPEEALQELTDFIQSVRDNAENLPLLPDGRSINELSDDELLEYIRDQFIPQSPPQESDLVDPYRYIIRESWGDIVIHDERDIKTDFDAIRNSDWYNQLLALVNAAHAARGDTRVFLRNRHYQIGDNSYPYNQPHTAALPASSQGHEGAVREDTARIQRKGRRKRPALGDPLRTPQRSGPRQQNNLAGISIANAKRGQRDRTSPTRNRRRNSGLSGLNSV